MSQLFDQMGKFNESFYLTNNPDVNQAVNQGVFASGQQHFDLHGAKELRNPNTLFDMTYYSAQNPDVAAAVSAGVFQNVFEHFLYHGLAEGRVPSEKYATFDPEVYMDANPDVRQAVEDGVMSSAFFHYVMHGAEEGRQGYTPVDGQTYTLTVNQDNFTGTAANDTFNAPLAQGPIALGNTLQDADVLDGGAGTDTLNATLQNAAAPSLTNIEILNLRYTAGVALDLANATGVEEINVNNSTAAGQIDNLGGIDTLSISNQNQDFTVDGSTAGTLNIALDTFGKSTANKALDLGAAVAAKATTLNLAVTNAYVDVDSTKGDVFTTVTVDAEGANNVNFVDSGATIKNMTVTGTGTVDFTGTALTALTTLDASGNSGGVKAGLTGNKENVTLTGSDGDDRFVLSNFNGNDKIDGGEGKDTLSVALADAVLFNKAGQVANIEVLEVTGAAAGTLNMDYFGAGNLTVVDGIKGNFTVSNLVNGATVQINADSTAAADLVLDVKGAIGGTNDVLTIIAGGAVDLMTKAVNIKAAGVETINFVTSSTAGNAFQVGALTDAQINTINISGKGDFTLGGATVGAIKSIDASAATGAVTISGAGSTTAVTFKGGEGIDTYTASAKGDTIYGSKGADIVTLNASVAKDILVYTAANQSNAAAQDIINGFATNDDLIKFDASLETGSATYLGAAAFTAGGNTELRFDNLTAALQVDFDGDGTADFVVTLAGVTAADFGAANFVFG